MTEPQFNPYHKWLGIRPSEQPATAYRLLGLARFESDPEVIESAADQRMAHVRTFQLGKHAALSQRLLNELAEAKVRLLNAETKAAYDAELQAADSRHAPAEAPPVQLPLPPSPARPQGVATVAAVPVPVAPVSIEPSELAPAPSIVRLTSRRRSKMRAPLWFGGAGAAALVAALIWTRIAPDKSRTPHKVQGDGQVARVETPESTSAADLSSANPTPRPPLREIKPMLTDSAATDDDGGDPNGKLPGENNTGAAIPQAGDPASRSQGRTAPSAAPAASEPPPKRSLADLFGAPGEPEPTPESKPAKSLSDFASSAPKSGKDKEAAARPRLAPKDAILMNGRWYWFSSVQATAQQAQLVAAKYKGRMLIISSAEENNLVVQHLKGPTFLGLLKIKGAWVNAERRPQQYFNWDRGQPSASGGERYAAIHPSGRWHDYREDTLYFCVEWGREDW